jgi:hypothetical protein
MNQYKAIISSIQSKVSSDTITHDALVAFPFAKLTFQLDSSAQDPYHGFPHVHCHPNPSGKQFFLQCTAMARKAVAGFQGRIIVAYPACGINFIRDVSSLDPKTTHLIVGNCESYFPPALPDDFFQIRQI